MIQKSYEIFDLITDAIPTLYALDLDGNEKVIATTEQIQRYLLTRYPSRRYLVTSKEDITTATATNSFTQSYIDYITFNQHGIDKSYQALFDYDYSPIENTDKYEDETIDNDTLNRYGKILSNSGSDSTTRQGTDAKTGTDTITNNGTHTNTRESAGFNAPNTYTPAEKITDIDKDMISATAYNSTNTINDSNTTAYGKATTESGNDSSENDIHRVLHTHGNIGVSTNTSLINEELSLRAISLVELILDRFINKYTYY